MYISTLFQSNFISHVTTA